MEPVATNFPSRILIVDDNKDIHEDIKYILTSSLSTLNDSETASLRDELFGIQEGTAASQAMAGMPGVQYQIDDAYQGEEAIKMVQKARSEGTPYSLVFMDVRMPPGMDGIQAIGEIWKIDPDVQVVICTAYSDYSWDQILLTLGQNDRLLFIRKPFDNVSVKQIALAMTVKWNLQQLNRAHIENLELQVEKRTHELKGLVTRLEGEVRLRKEKESLLAYNAHYDSLTGLLNRHTFYSSLSGAISENVEKKPFSLFFIDIDGFKKINDMFGHDTGDMLLMELSSRIREAVVPYGKSLLDPAGNSVPVCAIFRLGGDEFTAIVNESSDPKMCSIAKDLIRKVREPYLVNGNEIAVSCSVGISVYPYDTESSDLLLRYADIAMYKAKKRQGVYVFHEGPNDGVPENEARTGNALKHAVNRKLSSKH